LLQLLAEAFMRAQPANSISAIRAVVVAAVSAAPLVAQAEERGPGEIGHFVAIVTMFSLLFLSSLGFAIWLIVARLRSRAESSQGASPVTVPSANLDAIWFPGDTAPKGARRPNA
jgi:hypothetical protein